MKLIMIIISIKDQQQLKVNTLLQYILFESIVNIDSFLILESAN